MVAIVRVRRAHRSVYQVILAARVVRPHPVRHLSIVSVVAPVAAEVVAVHRVVQRAVVAPVRVIV